MNEVNDNVEFSNAILSANIMYFLRLYNKRIGDVERDAGVSPGYISRACKGNNAKPSIEILMRFAKLFGISIDTLLKVDLSKLSPTDYYILSFLDKLKRDTVDDKINWQVETADHLNQYSEPLIEESQPLQSPHLLYKKLTVYEDRGADMPIPTERWIFESRAFSEKTLINGNCYNMQFRNGGVIFVMNIYFSGNPSNLPSAKEIWMWMPNTEPQFLRSTYNDLPEISEAIEDLYSAIYHNAMHPKINNYIKNMIDGYMNEDLS